MTPAKNSLHSTTHGKWYGKGLARAAILVVAAALVAAVAARFSIAHDYGYLRATILSGSPGGYYYMLATRLADRAKRGHGLLTVESTEGSIENISRLSNGQARCEEMFGLIQDGTPISADAHVELLGRLPNQESLLLIEKSNSAFHSFADLRGASIGIGPDGSGMAYLMRQLFEDSDLRQLKVNLSNHQLFEQAELVNQGKLDIAAFVIEDDAQLLRTIMSQPGLDIFAPTDLAGLVARYPWLSLGTIAAGRFDLVRPSPAVDKQVARLNTLVVAGPCSRRADRIAFLVLLAAELPGFVHSNPPNTTSAATDVSLTAEARQFFLTGEPAIADRYFPWLVNLLSPAYWVYLVMMVTVLFNGMSAFSRFRLWRIDAARERLEGALKDLADAGPTHAIMREASGFDSAAAPERRAAAQTILQRLLDLRARCEHYTGSMVTPMGDEMYYRFQQSLIDEAITTVASLLQRLGAMPTSSSHGADHSNQ